MEEWEDKDDLPTDLNQWPSDPEAPELAGERRTREKPERIAEEGQAPLPRDD
jgi:hypothetical protein